MTEKKKIFILGGTGFVGTALTRQLAENRQQNDLMMLIHRRAPLRELEQINTNTGSLGSFDLSLLDRFSPDAIVHMARMSGRGRIGRFFAAWNGARANRRIIGHLRSMETKPHVIYVSGTLVYGDCGDRPADEDRPIHPVAFAREYISAEKPWMDALEERSVPVTILRPPWIVGKGSWFAGYYLKSIRERRVVPLFGDGQNWMSLIDVEDCTGLVAHAVRNADAGRYYNIFSAVARVTQREFAEKLAERTGSKVERIDADKVTERYGPTLWEAFTFSNFSATKYPEFIAGYDFKHASVEEIIRNNLPVELSA